MDTIRAVEQMAIAEADGVDSTRSPGAIALHRQSHQIHVAASKAIFLVDANALNPDIDRATQVRLAAAIDRQIAGKTSEMGDSTAATRGIMLDFLLQEAAGRALIASGHKDPLDHLAAPESNRGRLDASSILRRNEIRADSAFRSASKEDLVAIATGKFNQIEGEHVQFAVSTVLRLNDKQMATPTSEIPALAPAKASPAQFPAKGLGKGPRAINPQIAFGRKMSANER